MILWPTLPVVFSVASLVEAALSGGDSSSTTSTSINSSNGSVRNQRDTGDNNSGISCISGDMDDDSNCDSFGNTGIVGNSVYTPISAAIDGILGVDADTVEEIATNSITQVS